MATLFSIPISLLTAQLLVGLINGMFYAMLSLGLALIFGMLNIINLAHGAFFMMGAFTAWILLNWFGINYWWALLLAPLIVALIGLVIERLAIRRLYGIDHIYGLLMTFGLAQVLEGLMRNFFGASGKPYQPPPLLQGASNFGFMIMPTYRIWVVCISAVVCLITWAVIERTSLGARLRAATENPDIVRSFGINVPLMVSLTYAVGIALAAFTGVLAAPIYSVYPGMGSNLIIVVFAVVVIGGMGSIVGSVVTGIGLGLIEGLTKIVYPQASTTVVFVIMIAVLLLRPAGLFGRDVR